MRAVSVMVEATSGSPFTADPVPSPPDRLWAGHPLLTGCAVGEGYVVDSLAWDGEPADALVLMEEPALPGRLVMARPVALLHLLVDGERAEAVVCAAATCTDFADVTDVPDLYAWHADESAFTGVLARFGPAHAWQVLDCEGRQAAEEYVDRARHDFEQCAGGPLTNPAGRLR